jgi:Uma2 family endonuclease
LKKPISDAAGYPADSPTVMGVPGRPKAVQILHSDAIYSTVMSTLASQPVVRRMTYAEFLKADFENKYVEWVNGEVIPMPPIGDAHSAVNTWLLTCVTNFVLNKRLGEVRAEPFQMKTGADLPGRAPDLLFVSTANAKRLKKTYLQGPADLVVEIISPESGGRDRGDKYFEYEQGGVKEYWLIDPQRKQAEFYLRGKRGLFRPAVLAEDGMFHSVAIPGMWMDPNWFWLEPRPDPLDVARKWKLI